MSDFALLSPFVQAEMAGRVRSISGDRLGFDARTTHKIPFIIFNEKGLHVNPPGVIIFAVEGFETRHARGAHRVFIHSIVSRTSSLREGNMAGTYNNAFLVLAWAHNLFEEKDRRCSRREHRITRTI